MADPVTIPVPRVVSAAGFVTALGGGSLSPRVIAAMGAAARGSWRPAELQSWASEVIADVTGAEAGWVTSGASAGLTLAASACIGGTDPASLDRLPWSGGDRPEIIVQRGHRNAYDRALRVAGAVVVDVGYPGREGVGCTYEWQLEAAITSRTVAIFHLALADGDGLPLESVAGVAARHGIPVVVDAAAELPPAGNLRRFVDAGADLVVFSGGKAIRGPQATGVLAGRRELIASARLLTLDMDVDAARWLEEERSEPPHHGLGRSFKVGKEEIAGVVTALEEFVERDHERERDELRGWLEDIASDLAVPSRVESEPHFYPRLVVLPEDARSVARALERLRPAIVVPHAPLARGELVVCPEAIDPDDRAHVGSSIATLVAR